MKDCLFLSYLKSSVTAYCHFLFNKYVVFLFLWWSSFAYSQPVLIDKVGVDGGLSSNNILCITQDREGYVWIGTEWGLNRFDGHAFKTVDPAPPTGNATSRSGINKILVDKEDNLLWIAKKGGGLDVFDCVMQRFIPYSAFPDGAPFSKSDEITDLCFAEDGNIWIATYGKGLKKLDKRDRKISPVPLKSGQFPKDYRIRCIADDGKGNVYVGHWGEGFSVYSAGDHSVVHFVHDPARPTSLPGNEVLDICLDSKGNIWLATHWGLALYHPDRKEFTTFTHTKFNPTGLANSDVHAVREIGGKLWIGTWRGGVNILDLEKTDVAAAGQIQFSHLPFNDLPTGLSSPSITAIYQDSFGNIWLGSYGEGLNIIRHTQSFFNSLAYLPVKGNAESLSNKTVTSICTDPESRIWIGTDYGSIDIYAKDKGNSLYSKVDQMTLEGGVTALFADSQGAVWMGVDKVGLLRYDREKRSFEKIRLGSDPYFRTYIWCVYEDRDQEIWIGTHDGLFKYKTGTPAAVEIKGRDIGLPGNLISSLCQDANGAIWAGSMIDGVSILTPQGKLVTHIAWGDAGVNSIYRDGKRRMWVATNKGLAVFRSVPGHVYDYTWLDRENGFPDNSIRAVAEGKPDEFWITTHAGISRYTLHNHHVENFSYSNGISKETFRAGSVARTPAGTVFFGLQNSVCYFDPRGEVGKYTVPPLFITGFSVNNPQEGLSDNSKSLPVAPDIRLKYDQNTFTVEFSVLDYALSDRMEYAYSLKGEEGPWYDVNGQNRITFHDLQPGEYTLYLKSRVYNQDWSDGVTSLTIGITPPFWLSIWAKCIYVLLAVLIIYRIVRFYKRRLDLENQLYLEKQNLLQQQNLNDEKLRFYTSVTHELRTPLTLIMGPLEDLEEDTGLRSQQAKKISLIRKSAMRLYNLVNQIMEFRKSETHHRVLNVSCESLPDFLQEIVLKYKELNRNPAVSIRLEADEQNPVYYDREVLTIVLDNLLSNALKYTQEGQVDVILRNTAPDGIPYAEIEVRDTGYGIPEEALDQIFDSYYQVKGEHQAYGTGIGLTLVKNLVELHEGIIEVRSKPGEGTSFYVRIKREYEYPEATRREICGKEPGPVPDSLPFLLVVEDQEDIRNYISDSFSGSFKILTATNGQEGLKIATENLPDIVVSDIMMPVMDGIALCKALKEDLRTSHIPVILLTAKDTENDKTEGYFSGADSYIVKPFSAKLLRARIRNLLEGREKIIHYFSTNACKKVIASNALNKLDHAFMEKVVSIIEDHVEMEQMNVAFLVEQLNMSYPTFHRKLKAITGMSANELIRKVKMQHAEQLLLSRKYTVSEIMFKVGYSSRTYFREAFKTEFGMLPSKYIEKLGKEGESRPE